MADTPPSDNLDFEDDITPPQESAGKTFLHIGIGAVVLGALTGVYIWSAQRSHEAKSFVYDAQELVDAGDAGALSEAAGKYAQALEIESSNEYALSEMAFVQAMRYGYLGVSDAQAPARDYTKRSADENIERASRYAAEALLALSDNQAEQAEKVVAEVIERGAVSEKLYWVLGQAQRATGKLKTGRDNLRRALDSSTTSYYAVSLGDAYDADNDLRNASTFWNQAQKTNSNHLISTARSLLAAGRKGGPAKKLRAALAKLEEKVTDTTGDAEKAAVHLTRAEIFYQLGRIRNASKAAEEGLALRPEDPKLLSIHGRALFALGKTDDAFAAMQKALDNSGRAVRYLYELAHAFAADKKPAEALKVLQWKNESHSESPEYHSEVGRIHVALEAYKKAHASFDKALELSAKYPDALLGKGMTFWKQGKGEKAREWFEKAVSARTRFPEVYEAIGLMWIGQGNTTDGNRQIEEADKQFQLGGAEAVRLMALYNSAADALTAAKKSSMAGPWRAKAKAIRSRYKFVDQL